MRQLSQCRPVQDDSGGGIFADDSAVFLGGKAALMHPAFLYLVCSALSDHGVDCWWRLSMFPASVRILRQNYSASNTYETKFTTGEDVMVTVLKCLGLLIWALVFSALIRAVNNASWTR